MLEQMNNKPKQNETITVIHTRIHQCPIYSSYSHETKHIRNEQIFKIISYKSRHR